MTPDETSPANAGRDPLAYRDVEFLDSDEGRPLRILSEYLRPLSVFRRRRVHDTVVFFGSARIVEDGPLAEYYAAARELARLVTEWSTGLASPSHRYLVCSPTARSLDLIELDAASHSGVDGCASRREQGDYSARTRRYKVYIIDEVHMLTSAFNALLKTLEEPPRT